MRFLRALCGRIERLILTLVSKQWLVFGIGTWLLLVKAVTAEVWFCLCGVVIGVNTFQKIKGVGYVDVAARVPVEKQATDS